MPLVRGRKRAAEPDPEDVSDVPSSPAEEPPSQRRRLSPADEDDDAYGSETNERNAAHESEDQMVKKLVRLALACEYNRKPIRRAEITEKVLGNGSRAFKSVFQNAQLQLRTVFGMEMIELPGREKVTLQQKRAAQKSNTQASKTATNWVLRSILPSRLRAPDILEPIAAPTSADEAKYTALCSLLVSLVSLSGNQLPDVKMERYLRRLGLEDNTPIDGYEKTEKLMKRLDKDGYLMKVRESAGNGEEDVYWVVGPRAKVEIGETGISGLVKSVYNLEDGTEEDADLERRIGRSLGIGDGPQRQTSNLEPKKRGRKRRDEAEDDDSEDDDEDDD